mgnify:FL=1
MSYKITVHNRTQNEKTHTYEADMCEMACLRKKRTGLPVNIYVDDSGVWKQSGHAHRIKIQNNRDEHPVATDMIPMSIGEAPDILIKNPKMELSQSDINAVKKFIIANKDLLNRLGEDMDIDDFIKAMVVIR